jgi:hypothetical protein
MSFLNRARGNGRPHRPMASWCVMPMEAESSMTMSACSWPVRRRGWNRSTPRAVGFRKAVWAGGMGGRWTPSFGCRIVTMGDPRSA